MQRHTITEDEMTGWRETHWVQFAASFSDKSKKSLEISMDRVYRVTDHGAVLYIGGNAAKAISEYNGAP